MLQGRGALIRANSPDLPTAEAQALATVQVIEALNRLTDYERKTRSRL